MKLRKLVLAALFAALACGATMVIQVPSPIGGYLNLGDCIVLLSGWLLGPVYGAAAGIVSNLVQAAFGIVCAVLIKAIIDKKGLWKW